MAAAFRSIVSTLYRRFTCRHRALRLVTVVTLVSTVLAVGARRAEAQEVIEYYATDAVGSIRVVFAPDGTVKARSDYLPFGEELNATTPAGPLPTQRFTGQQRDAEEGHDNFNARSYQARTGRFTTVDPVFGGTLNPQRWNRYRYAANNPLSFIDPTGMADWCTGSTLDEYCEVQGWGGGWGGSLFPFFDLYGLGGGGAPCGGARICPELYRPPSDPVSPGYGDGNSGSGDGDNDGDGDTGGNTGGTTENPTTAAGTATTGPAVVINPATVAIATRVVTLLRAITPWLRVGAGASMAGMKVMQFMSQHQARMQSLVQQARQQFPRLAGQFQMHHIVPKYLGGAPNGPMVRLDGAYHQLITNEFRALWPYAGVPPSNQTLERIMIQVYTKYPIW